MLSLFQENIRTTKAPVEQKNPDSEQVRWAVESEATGLFPLGGLTLKAQAKVDECLRCLWEADDSLTLTNPLGHII